MGHRTVLLPELDKPRHLYTYVRAPLPVTMKRTAYSTVIGAVIFSTVSIGSQRERRAQDIKRLGEEGMRNAWVNICAPRGR